MNDTYLWLLSDCGRFLKSLKRLTLNIKFACHKTGKKKKKRGGRREKGKGKEIDWGIEDTNLFTLKGIH